MSTDDKTPDVGVRPVVEGEREALIRWFEPNLPAVIGGNPDADGIVWGQFDTQRATYLADAILASDWLAAHDARVLEEAQGEIEAAEREVDRVREQHRAFVADVDLSANEQAARASLLRQDLHRTQDDLDAMEAERDRHAVTLEKVRALAEADRHDDLCDTRLDDGSECDCWVAEMRAALDSSAQGVDGEEAVEG